MILYRLQCVHEAIDFRIPNNLDGSGRKNSEQQRKRGSKPSPKKPINIVLLPWDANLRPVEPAADAENSFSAGNTIRGGGAFLVALFEVQSRIRAKKTNEAVPRRRRTAILDTRSAIALRGNCFHNRRKI